MSVNQLELLYFRLRTALLTGYEYTAWPHVAIYLVFHNLLHVNFIGFTAIVNQN